MSARLTDLLAEARNPEYTGENRCIPCTATNVVIAALLAIGLASLLVTPVGVLAFLASLVVIYLRGYLVPGTPELTQQYFPPWLLSLFGKSTPVENVFDVDESLDATGKGATGKETIEPTETQRPTATATAETEGKTETAEGPLFAAGIVTRSETGEVVLGPAFRAAWRERIEASWGDVEPADVREAFDADTIKRTGETSFVIDSSASVRWESTAALLADVTAAALLRERLTGWADLEKDDRTATLTGLRLFLERCPSCDGTISSTDDRVDPCCQKPHLVTSATCEECGSLIADAAMVDSGEGSPVRVRLLRSSSRSGVRAAS